MTNIEFYFDFLSPFSYLAWQWVKDASRDPNLKFELIPCPLATVIKHYETKGPAEIEPKRNYLLKYCLRYSKLHGIPFAIPKVLPFNSLYALRVALKEVSGDDQFEIVDTLFHAAWGKGQDLGDDGVVLNLLNGLGLPGEKYLEMVFKKEARKGLKDNIKRALKNEVFGFPTFIVEDELFWGNDSITHIKDFLNGYDRLNLKEYNKFVASYKGTTEFNNLEA